MAKAETPTFTRGPLYASQNAVFAGKNCIGLADDEVIHRDEAAANARLWAASPDLYSALKLVKERRCADFTMDEWRQIDDAIARVGQSS